MQKEPTQATLRNSCHYRNPTGRGFERRRQRGCGLWRLGRFHGNKSPFDQLPADGVAVRLILNMPMPVRSISMMRSLLTPTRTGWQHMCSTAFALCTTAILLAAWHPKAEAIEMWTFFGDGGRIGLPNLEVPIEAYPGIPLRSDRIRMQNRSTHVRRSMPSQAASSGGITIRPMNTTSERLPTPSK